MRARGPLGNSVLFSIAAAGACSRVAIVFRRRYRGQDGVQTNKRVPTWQRQRAPPPLPPHQAPSPCSIKLEAVVQMHGLEADQVAGRCNKQQRLGTGQQHGDFLL